MEQPNDQSPYRADPEGGIHLPLVEQARCVWCKWSRVRGPRHHRCTYCTYPPFLGPHQTHTRIPWGNSCQSCREGNMSFDYTAVGEAGEGLNRRGTCPAYQASLLTRMLRLLGRRRRVLHTPSQSTKDGNKGQ